MCLFHASETVVKFSKIDIFSKFFDDFMCQKRVANEYTTMMIAILFGNFGAQFLILV